MRRITISTTAVLLLLSLGVRLAAASPMALIDPSLPGNTQYDEWVSGSLTVATNPGYPSFPGNGAWPAPIGSSAPGSADAELSKVDNGTGGGPYPAGQSIYYGGFSGAFNNDGGTLAVTDSTPIAGLSNLVFQIQIGEAWTWDFLDAVLPTLSYNGGSQNLPGNSSWKLEQFFNGTVAMPTGDEPVYINTYLVQWDLSSAGPITDLSIEFTGVQHAQLYAMRLDQYDAFEPYVVPEPGSMMLAGTAGLGLLFAARRTRRARRATVRSSS